MLSAEQLYLSVRELGELIRRNQISPVELTESYLRRSERIGPRLNAYVTLTRDLALKQARAAEREIAGGYYRGPLHGIPYAVKDLLAVKGYPTTWGAKPYAHQQFNYNATVVNRLSRAGAILIGKAAMIELAGGLGYRNGHASLTGPARNPWNAKYWTCGSSSGSGAITASGLAGFTLGSDTRGSIICPAAYCGVAGVRPSFGRVSRYGAMTIAYSVDKIGPLARSADDCGLILSVICGHDPKDYDSLPSREARFPYERLSSAPQRPLRIGRLTNAYEKMAPGLAPALERAFSELEHHGAHVAEAKLPEGPFLETIFATVYAESSSAFHSLIASGRVAELKDETARVSGYAREQIAGCDYLHAQRVRLFLMERINRLFNDFDVISTASFPGTAPLLNPPPGYKRPRYGPEVMGAIASLCGLPTITVPCGFSSEKLPFGIQFVGRVLNDYDVIAAARLFQRFTDWHKMHPHID